MYTVVSVANTYRRLWAPYGSLGVCNCQGNLARSVFSPFFSGCSVDILMNPAGQRVVVVRCEDMNISGSFYRNKCRSMGEGFLFSCHVLSS